ncbi:hypothetical protein QG071_10165 [Kingella kingae]|uniref:hypothetical protein n=1 Tax=Kingella kingae TaxID=504 RepID=UPI000A6826B5|nr:hypothetical protein [Kingella kingae]MDK4556380.1 hypothetical protein [Kingella kingae]MDK4611552.1 hypothetical protein [Kingella kingae]MDK4643346.1 hypothetical protein [Kingella kingae]MDK4653340.1 hypothetical protein [Kingella kingae]MDK4659306.1 hypothetical protein [Kingella kingae]
MEKENLLLLLGRNLSILIVGVLHQKGSIDALQEEDEMLNLEPAFTKMIKYLYD